MSPPGPAPGDGFGAGNLPYGIDQDGRVVVAYHDRVIDLATLHRGGHLGNGVSDVGVWTSGSLNSFFALGPGAWAETRALLTKLVSRPEGPPAAALRPRDDNTMALAWEVADYADFYASAEHASNMGRLLRPGSDPLPAAWRHLPMGYHGRAGTVVVSGTRVPRPNGLRGPGDFGPSRRLDVEVELGLVIGQGSTRGRPVAVEAAEQHLFGVVLLNDWSARDIQAFEYVPLGPFLGKSFATSVSPWVVPLAALRPWQVEGPRQDPEPAAYLRQSGPGAYDIDLELLLDGTPLSRTNASGLYWSAAQQLAHLTANGASLRPGDLLASGTISGATPGSEGSLMELAANGAAPLELADGQTRAWLEDGDDVVIRGWCGDRNTDGWVSLGEVRGTIVP